MLLFWKISSEKLYEKNKYSKQKFIHPNIYESDNKIIGILLKNKINDIYYENVNK